MADQHVLRIPRSDIPDSFVIVHVSGTKKHSTLDLRLVGTDGEIPYVKKVKASQIENLRTSNFVGSSEDWVVLMASIFLQESVQPSQYIITEGVEAVASVADGQSLDINIRKNISGITQRLGSIQLKAKEDEEINIFDWTGVAAQATSAAQAEAENLRIRYQEQEENIQKLHAQLNDLIHAKQEHESSMLEKFRLLLNAKKLKIRDQQRILAEAKVDDQKAAEVQSARATRKNRKPEPSRKSKRKAVEKPAESEVEAEVPGGEAESMDVDSETAEGEDVAPQMTPEPSDVSETEDEEEDAPPPSLRTTRRQLREAKGSKGSTDVEKAMGEPEELPPPRELPFLRGKAVSSGPSKPQPTVDDGKEDEDDETDDEL